MGQAKRELERYQDEKWSYVDDKNLCRSCLETGDDFVDFFSSAAVMDECEYCEKRKKVVDINELLEFIAEAIHSEYQDPVHSLPYESAEGGYYGAKIYETEDLFEELIAFNKDDVRDDIVSAFDCFAQWCERNPFEDRESDHLKLSWNKFSDTVKYERRYFFPRPKKENVSSIQANGLRYAGDILNVIFRISKELEIVSTLKKGTTLYRARPISGLEVKGLTLRDIGVPPQEVSIKRANRLSPAGIPIFYGGFSPAHLAKEIRLLDGQSIAIGKFITQKDLIVFDLTKIPAPSIFTQKDRDRRETIKFLNNFKRAIMIPVEHDGSEHVEYVPSQVFAEFIRHRCKYNGKAIIGIKYPSAFSRSDENIALFISNDFIEDVNVKKSKDIAALKFLGMEN